MLSTSQAIGPLQKLSARVDGRDVTVMGHRLPDGGVAFDRSDPFNARAIAAARPASNPRNFVDDGGRLNMFPVPANPKAAGPATPKGGRAAEPRPDPSIPNYGLAPDKLFHGYRSNYYTTPSPEARRFAFSPPGEPGRYHLTIIGRPEDTARVAQDIQSHPAFNDLRGRLEVQEYEPGHWAVDPKLGFPSNGKPSIVLQAQGGRVAWRANDYSGGPEGLAEAVRKADPDYRPESDPGPATGRSGSGCPLLFTADHWPAIVAVALIVLVLATRRKDVRTHAR